MIHRTAYALVLTTVLLHFSTARSLVSLPHLDFPRECEEICRTQPSWVEGGASVCATNGSTVPLWGCPFGSSNVDCYIKRDIVGVSYPGQCGCPNDCHARSDQGVCIRGSCRCNEGWQGEDCGSVKCEAGACGPNGDCRVVNGLETCVCEDGFAGKQCSATFSPLDPIQQSLPSTQYSGKDPYGTAHPIFNTSDLAQIAITLEPDDLAFLQDPENRQTREYQHARFWFHNHAVSEVVEDVGFRLKGGISREWGKKTWKISFNKFSKGRSWYAMKKLVLKGMSFDPSYMREASSADVLYSINAPAQRYSFAQLSVNGLDFGLVIMLENIDELYLESRFGTRAGKLYKCVGDLEYLGPKADTYKNLKAGTKLAYDPQTDEAEEGDAAELRNLIFVLNKSSSDSFPSEIQKVLDVDSFLRTYAMEVLTGQSDGIWNANNYFLYFDPAVGRFQYFRHDLDLSFGLFELLEGYEFMTRNIWTWYEGGRGYRLPERLMEVKEFRDIFSFYLTRLLSNYVNADSHLIPRMRIWLDQLNIPTRQEYWHEIDYLWTRDDFQVSVSEFVAHPTDNIFNITFLSAASMQDWTVARHNSAWVQLLEGPDM